MNEPDGFLRNIRLLIAYDGTDFSGWQRQGGAGASPDVPGRKGGTRTVQGTIEAALAKLHKRPVSLLGSGRTDAGVHAAGQVANFYTTIRTMDAERFVPALNSLLPQDVRVLEARETLSDFHARFDARSRTYRYQCISGRAGLPYELRYALQLWRRPRLSVLNAYARQLLGERDCSLFAVPRDPSESRRRYISAAHFLIQGDHLIFEVTANAFLWKMVRSMVGTLFYYEEKDLRPDEFKTILESGQRSLAGPTAPPRGLFLWKIDYYRD